MLLSRGTPQYYFFICEQFMHAIAINKVLLSTGVRVLKCKARLLNVFTLYLSYLS